MKKQTLFSILALATFGLVVVFAALMAPASAQASPVVSNDPAFQAQATVVVPTVAVTVQVQPGVTVVVPNTGTTQTGGTGYGWIIWVVLGIALVALIVALVARPSETHYHDHE